MSLLFGKILHIKVVVLVILGWSMNWIKWLARSVCKEGKCSVRPPLYWIAHAMQCSSDRKLHQMHWDSKNMTKNEIEINISWRGCAKGISIWKFMDISLSFHSISKYWLKCHFYSSNSALLLYNNAVCDYCAARKQFHSFPGELELSSGQFHSFPGELELSSGQFHSFPGELELSLTK